jgi:hypothetical protein
MRLAPRWKAFAIWLALPYLSYEIVVPGMLLLFSHDVALAPMYRVRNLATVLAICTGLAVLGTITVWLLPIRRPWVGIFVGVTVAAAGVALWAWLEMTFLGGFEENVDIYVTALLLMPPSCLAGAYSGFVRSRASQSRGQI